MQTFNVGDRVKVDSEGMRPSKKGVEWPRLMDRYQGIVTTVCSVTNRYSCRLSYCGPWNFDNTWLTKVNKFKGNAR